MQRFKILIYIIIEFSITKYTIGQTISICDNSIYISNYKISDTTIYPDIKKYQFWDSLKINMGGCFEEHKIIKDSGDMFLCIPFYDFEDKRLSAVWLKKTPFIRINIRQNEGNLIFYDETVLNSKQLYNIDIAKNKLFDKGCEVINCKKGWYKIKLNINGKTYQGWVQAHDLCPNPCSTCG